MRKIFTFLCAALMSVGMYAATVVTITNNDFPEMDVFTKDGVTVSADWIDNMDSGHLVAPGSFSTTLGNFTKIEVNAGEVLSLGEGWSGNSERQTWTGNASSVSFSGDISGLGHGITIMCTIEESAPEPAKYYIVGSMNSWGVDENYEMNPNIYAETEEYFYALDLTTTSEFKVVKVEGENQTWYPTGMGNNYGENGEITEDAEYTIYFRPNYNGGEDWFYNCIYVSKNEPEPAQQVITWNSSTISSIGSLENGESFTKDGVTVTVLNGIISRTNKWQGNSADASFKFSTSLGNFTRIEVTAEIRGLGGSGWTQSDPGAVWTGDANETTFGMYFKNVSQVVFTIESQGGTTAVENVQTNHVQATKFFRDGQLLIEKNGKIYTVTGQQVR